VPPADRLAVGAQIEFFAVPLRLSLACNFLFQMLERFCVEFQTDQPPFMANSPDGGSELDLNQSASLTVLFTIADT